MNEVLIIETKMLRPAMVEHQELRKYVGEALREPIPWNQHPAWTVIAERLGDAAPAPPPAYTSEEIHALIGGRVTHAWAPCPNCGHVLVETR